jgi:hypothetical protein
MSNIAESGSGPPPFAMTSCGAAAKSAAPDELHGFENGQLDPAKFPHAEHVRVGYEMLARHSFGEAVERFSQGLKLLAARAGRPEIYHETITVAFLALINERRARANTRRWEDFRSRNADLLDKRCLEKWYSPEQLSSDLARRTFCLPEGVPTKSTSRCLKSPVVRTDRTCEI